MSVWLGHSPHESLLPYLGGPGGEVLWLDFLGHVRNRLPIDPRMANTCVTATSTQNRHRIFLTLQGLTWLFFLTFLPKEVCYGQFL